ncbi:MAG: DUF1592 domain-containing protein [Planctomycetaceae bacterium]
MQIPGFHVHWAIALIGCLVVPSVTFAAEPEAWAQQYLEQVMPVVRQKCVKCHGKEEPDGGIDLASPETTDQVIAQHELWSLVGKRIRLNEMPPQGSPQLSDPEKAAFMRWIDSSPKQNLCNQLASDETQSWYRGYVMSRRLTQTEYNNMLRDLFGVDLQVGRDLPADGAGGEGFDTAGDTLFTSPIHLEKYLLAADRAIETVLPDSTESLSEELQRARERLLAPLSGTTGTPRESARKVLDAFVNRAYRRPVASEEIERLLQLFDTTFAHTGNMLAGIRQTLKAVLVSPHFLFIGELEHEGGVQRLTPHEFATRLALLVWSSLPDEELRTLADAGTLFETETIRQQIRRMLADPKARALGENFAMQWLGLNRLGSSVRPDSAAYPEFNDELAYSMREEVIRTTYEVFRENRSLLEFVDASDVVIDEPLARLYGLTPPPRDWQRVPSGDSGRGGLVTTAAMLASTSYPVRTSPVLRGSWVLENILGERVPPPPPNVPSLEETAKENQALTFRERLEQHRRDPQCGSCHNRIDPLGFSLEQYDVLGRFRERDASGQPIDASGELPSGQKFIGASGLKQVLLARKRDVMKHLAKKMLGYALGRELNKFDACVIDETLKELEGREYRSHVLIEQIALSYPFQHRYFKKAD